MTQLDPSSLPTADRTSTYSIRIDQVATSCIIIIMLRLAVAVMHVGTISSEADVRHYLSAPATIRVRSGTTGTRVNQIPVASILSYTYYVDGALYDSDRYSALSARRRPSVPRPPVLQFREIAGTAYYNPRSPSNAVLQRNLSAFAPAFFGVAGAFTGAIVLLLTSAVHRMLTADSKSHGELALSSMPSPRDARRWALILCAMLAVDIVCVSIQVAGMWMLLAMSGLPWTDGTVASVLFGTLLLTFITAFTCHKLLAISTWRKR